MSDGFDYVENIEKMENDRKMEFERIVNDERVDQSLINHTQFFRSFRHVYDELSGRGKWPVKVDVDRSGNVILSVDFSVPTRSDVIYSSERQISKHTFSLRAHPEGSENEYFCDEIESINAKYPQNGAKPEKSIGASKELKVYKFNELVANSWNCVFSNVPLNYNDVYARSLVPAVGLGYALTGSLPTIDEGSLWNSNYKCETSRSENGIVQTMSRRKDGWSNPVWEHKYSEGYLVPGYETLERSRGSEYYSHTKVTSPTGTDNKEETLLDNRFGSVSEARTYFSNYYTSATEGPKTM